jgi:dTDP-glucose pyrophosphorylase/CBS domain-containing protein
MKDWSEILLSPDDSIQTTIKVIHSGGHRAALVVDNDRKLLGIVTDGDIRRALITHVGMECTVKEVMNNAPATALRTDQSDFIMSKMIGKGLLHMPIVDKQGTLVGLETLPDLLKNKKYDNPVFLMAGGFGERLKPLTDSIPKPLLKVGTKPILENILDQFISAGFHNFYISTHYKAEMVRKHFGDGSDWNISIEYIHEEKPLGTAGGLGLLPANLPNLPILVMNGDLLTKVDFEQLLDFHIKEGGDATMCVREYDFQVPYGVIKSDGNKIISIEEKPLHKFFVNAGIYILNPSMLDMVDGINYMDMPKLLEKKIEDNGQINMFPVYEYWLDIGQMEQFNQAQLDSKELFK